MDQILADAETEDQAENIRKWYDGYHFGDFDVYCPWDVMNYLLERSTIHRLSRSVIGKIPAIMQLSVLLSIIQEAASRRSWKI